MRCSYLLTNYADRCRVLSRLIDHVWSRACVELRKLCCNMNKRKEPTSKQPGIDRFFSKSQRTDGKEEGHKTAGRGGRQILAISTASSTASTSAARGQPVEPSIMLQRVEEKFPESRNVKAFHSYYQCNRKRCSMSDPAYLSSSKGKTAR